MTIDQVPSMEEILAVHGDGIAAIAEIAGRLDDDAWDRQTPCDGWTAQDLAGHVVTVSTNARRCRTMHALPARQARLSTRLVNTSLVGFRFAVGGAVYGEFMEPVRNEIDDVAEPAVRFHPPDEPLSAAAEEALRRRTPEEHQAAIDRALRRS